VTRKRACGELDRDKQFALAAEKWHGQRKLPAVLKIAVRACPDF